MPKILYSGGTKLTFKGSGGDVTLTFAGTAVGALAVSDQYDRGSGSQPGLYRWRIKTRLAAGSGVLGIGDPVRIYLIQTDDATDIPGRVGASDTEISSPTSVGPSSPIGQVIVDLLDVAVSSITDLIATGLCFIDSRYISVALYNATTQALNATESLHYFELTPMTPENQ